MNKWSQTFWVVFAGLALTRCTPWYDLQTDPMYTHVSAWKTRPENPCTLREDFQFEPLTEKTDSEIRWASQSAGRSISPEEELELLISQFTSQGRPVPPELAPETPAKVDFPPAIFDGENYLEKIVPAATGDGRKFLIQLRRTPQYQANSISEPNYYRVYIDFFDTQLAASAQKIPVNRGAIYQIRSGQFNSRTARVVFDSRRETPYRIYRDQLQNSLVVEFEPASWESPEPARGENSLVAINRAAEMEFANLGVVQELGLKIRRIIIDPGHGGSAPGAVGPTGLQEKEVVFEIARWLRKLLTDSGEFEALLTREDDQDLALEERTRFANARAGDLFISIHANASKNRESQGLETYYLSLAKDNDSRRVAAFENQSTAGEFRQLDETLSQILKQSKVKESAQLARVVQQHLVGRTQLYDGGVRQAGFVVLIGANMPAILVETGYISNPVEEQLLRQPDYHRRIAQAIFEGILQYRQQTSVLAAQIPD